MNDKEKESEDHIEAATSPKNIQSEVAPESVKKSRKLKSKWPLNRFNAIAASGLVFAGFWYRLLAFLVDMTLSLALAIGIVFVIELMVPERWMSTFTKVGTHFVVMVSIQAAYFIGMEQSAWKATLGKRWLKLRVTDMRGQRMSLWTSILRSALKASVPLTFGAGLVFILITDRHQALHDKFARTLVLRKSAESFLPRFLPPVVRRFHWFIVIFLTIGIFSLGFRAVLQRTGPVLELLTMRMTVQESIKELAPAQRLIETEMINRAGPPRSISPTFFNRAGEVKEYLYSPKSGSLTVLFQQGKLRKMGLVLTPFLDEKAREVTWACAAIDLPKEFTPDNCAASN